MNGIANVPPDGPRAGGPDSESDLAVEANALALARIESMCAVTRTSAEGVAREIGANATRINRLRFASAKRMSLELAITMSEASYRDAALCHIIDLCMAANDMETSRILVQGIQSEPIREELFLSYPAIFR
jgi:hypothetical protein